MERDRITCITLDLENDWYFDDPNYDHLTFEYIEDYVDLISDLDVPLSIFVVGRTLERFPKAIAQLQENLDVEFHLHSYRHDHAKLYDFEDELKRGIRAFESFFGTEPTGYRAPQGNLDPIELSILEDYGFRFDSSVFPSYRPGRYNNLDAPLSPYRPDEVRELVEFPLAAVPWLRIPISQSYLKLLGDPFLEYVKRVRLPEVLVFDSHLQDFYRTASHDNLSLSLQFIHKRNLSNSIDIFRELIAYLRDSEYAFAKISTVHDRVVETL